MRAGAAAAVGESREASLEAVDDGLKDHPAAGRPSGGRRHAERVGADDPSKDVTRACVTASESLERRRLFRRWTPPVDVYMLLAEPLFVIVADQDGRMIVSFHRPDEIELTEFESTLVDDVGVELVGMAMGATERAMRFLPLDHGPAGAGFRTALLDAARQARTR